MTHEPRKTVLQFCYFTIMLAGIGMFSVPCALIVGGLAMVLILEVRP